MPKQTTRGDGRRGAKKSVARKASSNGKARASAKSARGNGAAKKKVARRKKGPTERALASVDPEKRELYDELLREIEDAKLDEKRGWDRKYEAVGEVIDASLFLLTPHGNAEAWCKAVLDESYRNVSRNVRVARHFSPDAETKYTVPRLDAFLTYIEAKTGGPIKGVLKVDLDAVRIPLKRDGKTQRLKLIDVDPDELLALAREEAGESASARARRSPIEQAFAEALHGDDRFSDVTVRVHDNQITLGRIPLSHLPIALEILRDVDWEGLLPTYD